MDYFLADFSESSIIITVPTGPKVNPPSFDNDIITNIELSQLINYDLV